MMLSYASKSVTSPSVRPFKIHKLSDHRRTAAEPTITSASLDHERRSEETRAT